MASEYAKKLQDPRWQKKRLKIFERDDWRCTKCGRDDQSLHVHHKRYIAGRDPWEYADHYLVTVCHACHSDEHGTAPEITVKPASSLRLMPAGLDDFLDGGKFAHLLSADERAQAYARKAQELAAIESRRVMLERAAQMGLA